MAWVSQFLKEFDRFEGEDCNRVENFGMMSEAVRCLRSPERPTLCCLEEITRRVCQLDEACERGARQVIHQRAIQLQQHRACVHEEFRLQEGKGGGRN